MTDSFSIYKKPQGMNNSYQAASTNAQISASAATSSGASASASSDTPLSLTNVYGYFVNSINKTDNTERKIAEVGLALSAIEAMFTSMANEIGTYMDDVQNANGASTSVNLGSMPMSYQGKTVIINGQPVYLNQVITKTNHAIAILNTKYSDFYESAKDNNATFLSKLPNPKDGLLPYLPTFGEPGDGASQDGVNEGPQTFTTADGTTYTYDAPAPLNSGQDNAITALQDFQTAISSAESGKNNVSIATSQLQRDINNAWKTLSSELKALIAMVTQIINNI